MPCMEIGGVLYNEQIIKRTAEYAKTLDIHAVFQLRDSKFLTLVLSPIFFPNLD